MLRLIFLLLLISIAIFSFGQMNSGFLKGDEELKKYIQKRIIKSDYEDSTPYIFTIAVVSFNESGKISSVNFTNEGYEKFKKLISNIITNTDNMWDISKVKNSTLLIPFESITFDKSGNEPAFVTNKRMISNEFILLFKENNSLNAILIQPIVITHFASIH